MRRAFLSVLAAALLLPGAASAKLPRHGVLVVGRSLASVGLGARSASVRAALGSDFGVCRGCATTTWYYTYRPFAQTGLGVEFRSGRVAAVYTLSEPQGWHTSNGLALGASLTDVKLLFRPLTTRPCRGYTALTIRRGTVVTAFYVVDSRLWGFGIQRPGVPVCR